MTLNVALTGSIASGKSSVAGLWAAEGVPVASADAFARQAVAPGSAGLAAQRFRGSNSRLAAGSTSPGRPTDKGLGSGGPSYVSGTARTE